MKSIGGYFELACDDSNFLHKGAILLNTGRNALEYILKARKYNRIFLPLYTCDVLLEPITKLKIAVERYAINSELEPVFDYSNIQSGDAFLYTNYFSLKDLFINQLAQNCRNLIVDNAQAFFSLPVGGIDTFYSPRKYFGLPDGGLLYTKALLEYPLSRDVSVDRISHLITRAEQGPEMGYPEFTKNEDKLRNGELMGMSTLTKALMMAVDLNHARSVRSGNFEFLHERIGDINEFPESLLINTGFFCYPLLHTKGHLIRRKLIENRIYVPTFWPELSDHIANGSIEQNLVDNLVCLPIDQRYSLDDMRYISNLMDQIGE